METVNRMSAKIRILIADDHEVVRRGLALAHAIRVVSAGKPYIDLKPQYNTIYFDSKIICSKSAEGEPFDYPRHRRI